MHKLNPDQKYDIKIIAETLNLSTILAHGIRDNFGNPISINELKKISQNKFLSCKNLGIKRLKEFRNALYKYSSNNDRAVNIIGVPSIQTIVVEINLSKPFRDVIKDLNEVIANYV